MVFSVENQCVTCWYRTNVSRAGIEPTYHLLVSNQCLTCWYRTSASLVGIEPMPHLLVFGREARFVELGDKVHRLGIVLHCERRLVNDLHQVLNVMVQISRRRPPRHAALAAHVSGSLADRDRPIRQRRWYDRRNLQGELVEARGFAREQVFNQLGQVLHQRAVHHGLIVCVHRGFRDPRDELRSGQTSGVGPVVVAPLCAWARVYNCDGDNGRSGCGTLCACACACASASAARVCTCVVPDSACLGVMKKLDVCRVWARLSRGRGAVAVELWPWLCGHGCGRGSESGCAMAVTVIVVVAGAAAHVV